MFIADALDQTLSAWWWDAIRRPFNLQPRLVEIRTNWETSCVKLCIFIDSGMFNEGEGVGAI